MQKSCHLLKVDIQDLNIKHACKQYTTDQKKGEHMTIDVKIKGDGWFQDDLLFTAKLIKFGVYPQVENENIPRDKQRQKAIVFVTDTGENIYFRSLYGDDCPSQDAQTELAYRFIVQEYERRGDRTYIVLQTDDCFEYGEDLQYIVQYSALPF